MKQNDPLDYETAFTDTLAALQKANRSHSFGLCKTCGYFAATADNFV
ncbi:hypothetical protein [Methyloglobulus morosus]|nr:hypothetical protein [Methyloglobulus morosus]